MNHPLLTAAAMILAATQLSAPAIAGTAISPADYMTYNDYPVRMAPPPPEPETHTPLLEPVRQTASPVSSPAIVIQVGAFSHFENAARRAESLSGFGPTRIVHNTLRGQTLYRVYLGQFQRKEDASTLLGRVRRAGFDGFLTHPK